VATRAPEVEAVFLNAEILFAFGDGFASVEFLGLGDEGAAASAAHGKGRHQTDCWEFVTLRSPHSVEFRRIKIWGVIFLEDLSFRHGEWSSAVEVDEETAGGSRLYRH
jgi:hypothetical protein